MKTKSARKRQRSKKRSRRNSKIPNCGEILGITTHPSFQRQNETLNSVPATNAASLWRDMYESLVIRQCEVKIEYWKQRAMRLEQENEELRHQLQANVPVYETSSEEDDEEQRYLDGADDDDYNEEDLSPEYLAFRSVTLQHREELRKQRERERLEDKADDTTLNVSHLPDLSKSA
ncbi:unnamed protein product [Ceratitis capitata]|uniref:(Mediterranean fruit fly) hypothetical protein n=1 Tax=Ceratitis capitata TaxID=7213 RepID=W8BZZ4_CERCA|nr:unnamed protein product [Ceratitis capitata]